MAISTSQTGCCMFLRWPSRNGYRLIGMDGYDSPPSSAVRVVVGKEKRLFFVDPFVLEKEPFTLLMELVKMDKVEESIYVDVDAILFEHMLWLVYNNDFSSNSSSSNSSSSLFHLNLREIIEFYSQDY